MKRLVEFRSPSSKVLAERIALSVCIVGRSKRGACLALIWAVSISPIHVAATARPAELSPLPFGLAISLPSFGWRDPPRIAPDGKHVAYTQCVPHASGSEVTKSSKHCSVTVSSVTDAADTRHLTSGSYFPIWSPSGAQIAFLCPLDKVMSVCVWSTRTHEVSTYPALRLGASAAIGWLAAANVQWLSDETGFVVTGETADLAEDSFSRPTELGENVRVFRSPENRVADSRVDPNEVPEASGSYSSSHTNTIYVVDEHTGAVRTLLNVPGGRDGVFTTIYAVAPNAPLLAVMLTDSPIQASDHWRATLRILNLNDGTTVRAIPDIEMSGPLNLSWSPDGKRIAWHGVGMRTLNQKRILFCKIDDGVVMAADDAWTSDLFSGSLEGQSSIPPLWSRSGLSLFSVSARGSESPINRQGSENSNALVVTDLNSRLTRTAFERKNLRILSIVPKGFYNGVLQSSSFAWMPARANNVILLARNIADYSYSFIEVNIDSGAATTLLRESAMYDSPVGDSRGEKVAFFSQSVDRPPAIWLMAPNVNSKPVMISDNQQHFRGYALGKSKLLKYKVADGRDLHAAILLPPGFQPGSPVPTVVYPYGSSYKSRALNVFGGGESDAGVENLQLFATRGIAVLLPDLPYASSDVMEEDAALVMPAIEAAVAAGFSDPNRLGVMGHSHGGFDAYALIVQSPRFKAAVVRAGFADWASLANEMDANGFAFGASFAIAKRYGLGTDLWTDPKRYLAESPLYRFESIKGAVLIIQGSADVAIRPSNAEEAFVGLKQLHKNVQYVLYRGGEHSEALLPPDYQIDYLRRVLDWFQRYL